MLEYMWPGNAVSTLEDTFEEMQFMDVGFDDILGKYNCSAVIQPEDSVVYEDIFYSPDIYKMNIVEAQKYLNCKIRNHDCMWAGHCGSKEHPTDEPRPLIRTIPPIPPVIDRSALSVNKQAVTSGRSLLLKTAIRQQQQQTQQIVQPPQHHQSVSPDSPPMSDDEECKTTTLQMLQEVISSCDIEDADSDLCEYFEEEDFLSESVEDTTPQSKGKVQPKPPVVHYARDNDHSYHKDKNASMHLSNLGIETPSDSEEEIDVVSVGDNKHTTRAMVSSLPNNPTSTDRQQLQKTMATMATTNKCQTTPGIKTVLPFRKPTSEQSPAKRKAPENRGIKRTRHRTPSNSPHKRRCYNHSSDSEAEPSEKRSLHNNMERQRRIDLRNAFEDLRLLVPQVAKKNRAAKVVILREAAVYCDALGDISDKIYKEKEAIRHEQDRLRERLSALRKAFAAKHR